MSIIVIGLTVAVLALVVWLLTPSGEKEVAKADAAIVEVASKAQAAIAADVSKVKAEEATVKKAVETAVTTLKRD